jgi:hypothetical protein
MGESRPQMPQERKMFTHRPGGGGNRDQRSNIGVTTPRPLSQDSRVRPSRQDSFSRRPLHEERHSSDISEKERVSDRDQTQTHNNPRFSPKNEEKTNISPSVGFRSQPVVRTSEKSPKISLQSLRPSEKEASAATIALKEEVKEKSEQDTKRKEVNTSDLRDMLKQALDEHAANPSMSKAPGRTSHVPPPVVAENDADDKKELILHQPTSSGHILKPGDTIKF